MSQRRREGQLRAARGGKIVFPQAGNAAVFLIITGHEATAQIVLQNINIVEEDSGQCKMRKISRGAPNRV